VLVVHNFADEPIEVVIQLADDGRACDLVNLFGDAHSVADERRRHHLVLEPYGYRWYRIGGLDYLLRRTEY
jgi:maltose alpha-D-glucosyltransferase/alpha-amylase